MVVEIDVEMQFVEGKNDPGRYFSEKFLPNGKMD